RQPGRRARADAGPLRPATAGAELPRAAGHRAVARAGRRGRGLFRPPAVAGLQRPLAEQLAGRPRRAPAGGRRPDRAGRPRVGAELPDPRPARRAGPAAVPRSAQRARLGEAPQRRQVGAQPVRLHLRSRPLRRARRRARGVEPGFRRRQPGRGPGGRRAEPAVAGHALRAVGLFPRHPPTGRPACRPPPTPAAARLSEAGAEAIRPGVPRPAGLGQERLRHRRPAARLPEPAQAGPAGHGRTRHAGLQQQPGQGGAGGLAPARAALRREGRAPGARLAVPAASGGLPLLVRRTAAEDADPAALASGRADPPTAAILCAVATGGRSMLRLLPRLAYRLALFLAFYALIGFFILPGVALRIANQQLAQHATVPAQLERLEFNPFTLRLDLHGLRIGESATPQLAFEKLHADLEWSSLWRLTPHLALVRLTRPHTEVLLDPDGQLNLAQLFALPESTEEPPVEDEATEPFPLRIDRLVIEEGHVHFQDRQPGETVDVTYSPLNLELHNLHTRP